MRSMRVLVALMLVCIVSLVVAGCRDPKPVGSSMFVSQKNALKASLEKLEETLTIKSPYILAQLTPGASDEDLKALRSELGGVQIESLELWYQWHNPLAFHR